MSDRLEVCSSRFTWGRNQHGQSTACAEISDLSDLIPSSHTFPEGFHLRSSRTNECRVFTRDSAFMVGVGEDRELGGYTYVSPTCAITITLFND